MTKPNPDTRLALRGDNKTIKNAFMRYNPIGAEKTGFNQQACALNDEAILNPAR